MRQNMMNAAAIVAAGLWINFSEFLRNEILLGTEWKGHFMGLGLVFPSTPMAGMIWGIWGFIFAAIVFAISRRHTLIETTIICWVAGFLLMWLVSWNLLVLPLTVLPYAVPLSLLETLIAAAICVRVSPLKQQAPVDGE